MTDKIGFASDYQDDLDIIASADSTPLDFSFDFLRWHWNINFSFYEPYRLIIRGLGGAFFFILAFKRCFKMISSVFGISFGGVE